MVPIIMYIFLTSPFLPLPLPQKSHEFFSPYRCYDKRSLALLLEVMAASGALLCIHGKPRQAMHASDLAYRLRQKYDKKLTWTRAAAPEGSDR